MEVFITMKRIIAAIISLFVVTGFSFAQSEVSALPDDEIKVDLTKKIISPKNQHLEPEDKTGKVVIEYIPMTDEARVYYTCMYESYEKGRAMNAILGCLEDFLADSRNPEVSVTDGREYYRYRYMDKDRERYYRDKDNRRLKWTEYSVHVKFIR